MSNSVTSPRSPEELVQDFKESDKRLPAYFALSQLEAEALPAIEAGLKHGHWQVRRWCAILLDHLADDEALLALVPLLRDPKSQVRLWAVHSISCEGCKTGANPIDTVPLLLERIEVDESIRVRRMAVAMLAHECTAPDPRIVPVLERALAEEGGSKAEVPRAKGTGALHRGRAPGVSLRPAPGSPSL